MVTPLHVHSDASALDGVQLPIEIAHRAQALGCEACGLTDHGVVVNHLSFAKELAKVDIKPVFGCELYHGLKWTGFKGAERDQAHLVALAITNEGLRNLWRLIDVTAHPDRFRWVGRNSWEDFEKWHEGLILTSACAAGLVPKGIMQDDYEPLNRYLDVVGDRFYLALHTYRTPEIREINEALVQVGQERGIPFVYEDDAHHLPDQYEMFRSYIAASTKQSVYTPDSDLKMHHPYTLYMKEEDEVREDLSNLPENVVDEAIENAHKIGQMASATLPETHRHLPKFIPKESPWVEEEYDDDGAWQLLIDLVERGLVGRYGEDAASEVWERAETELEVLIDAGLEDYFLIAWDQCQFCSANDIGIGPGRGSSAGSIVAYALGITDVDPIHYNLLFTRFYNAGRAKGLPDIDTDFPVLSRGKVKEYLAEKRWGPGRVKAIGTTSRMKPKAAIDRFWQWFEVTKPEASDLKKIIDEVPDINILGPDSIAWSRECDPDFTLDGKERTIYVEDYVEDKILEWIDQQPADRHEKLANFIWFLERVCNRIENYGVHASGVVVSDVDLNDELPCDLRGPKEKRIPATEFTMDDVDAREFMKLDILGLRTLDVLDDWVRQMAEEGIEINWSGLDKEDHPVEMWEQLDRKESAGIFQIEEGGFVKECAANMKVRSVEDLGFLVALNRPGPMSAADSILTRRFGGEDDQFDGRKIPVLKSILDSTYGWFLYQEQVIQFFGAIGYDEFDADAVRKILGKKKPEAWRDLALGQGEWEGKGFFGRAEGYDLGTPPKKITIGRDGLEFEYDGQKTLAITIWETLERFAKYSFNKSHAIAYGIIAFRCLYAKYYGTAQFYRSCIAHVPKDKKEVRIPAYVSEARRRNIPTLPPDIDRSLASVAIIDGEILFGFGDVKNVGVSGDYLVELRESAQVDISTPEALSASLAEIGKVWSAQKKQALAEGNAWTAKSPKQQLQASKIQALLDAGAWDARGERDGLSLQAKQKFEKELLGVILSDDSEQVINAHRDQFDACDEYSDAEADWNGEDLRWMIPGVIVHIRETKTRRDQKRMGIVTCEYDRNVLEFAVFPKQWKDHKFLFRERQVGIFHLKRTPQGLHFERGHRLTI